MLYCREWQLVAVSSAMCELKVRLARQRVGRRAIAVQCSVETPTQNGESAPRWKDVPSKRLIRAVCMLLLGVIGKAYSVTALSSALPITFRMAAAMDLYTFTAGAGCVS